jgi:hypothetical protein
MKTTFLATLACVLVISGTLFAQENSTTAKQENPGLSTKPLIVSGRLSNDGRTLLTDIDSEWIVDNSESVKGYEGRLVKVKCYVDTEKSRIHILSVRKDDQNFSFAARQTDSAFRR